MKVIVKEHEYHVELLLTDDKLKEDITKKDYKKIMFFFVGFDQQAERFVNKFSKILTNGKLYQLKIILVKMYKETKPHPSVGFFYDENYLNTLDKVHTYYRIARCNINLIHAIYWIPLYDICLINIIKSEYINLNCNWKNFAFCGFSMGGRYAIHLLELLNAEVSFLFIAKTYIMQYLKGESQYDSIVSRYINRPVDNLNPETLIFNVDNHPQMNPNKKDFGDMSKIKSNTGYTCNYEKKEDIEKLFSVVEEFNEYQRKNDRTNRKINKDIKSNTYYLMDHIEVIMKYSLHDPLTINIIDYTLNILQTQFPLYRISYDNEEGHRVDSALEDITNALIEFNN